MDHPFVRWAWGHSYITDYVPSATVLHSKDKLLLANVTVPWKLICTDRSVPLRHHGEKYITINKDDLYGSAISTQVHFISETITSCPEVSDNRLNMSYSFNAAMIMYFKSMLNREQTDINVRQLYQKQPHIDLPEINIKSIDNGEVLKPNYDNSRAVRP